MERSRATFEAYDGVEVTLRSGKVVRCEALTVRQAVRWLRALDVIENADDVAAQNRAIVEVLEGFAEEVGITEETLSPPEVLEVARSFLRLPTWSPTGRETTRTTGGATSSGPSTPSSNSTPDSTT